MHRTHGDKQPWNHGFPVIHFVFLSLFPPLPATSETSKVDLEASKDERKAATVPWPCLPALHQSAISRWSLTYSASTECYQDYVTVNRDLGKGLRAKSYTEQVFVEIFWSSQTQMPKYQHWDCQNLVRNFLAARAKKEMLSVFYCTALP